MEKGRISDEYKDIDYGLISMKIKIFNNWDW